MNNNTIAKEIDSLTIKDFSGRTKEYLSLEDNTIITLRDGRAFLFYSRASQSGRFLSERELLELVKDVRFKTLIIPYKNFINIYYGQIVNEGGRYV